MPKTLRPILCAMAGGLLLASSFPSPWAPEAAAWQAVLAWIALLPLLAALEGAPPGRAALLGWIFGLAAYGPHCAWIFNAWPVGWPASLSFGALSSYAALYPSLFGLGLAWLRRRGAPLEALWAPALWTCTELLREMLLSGIPAYSLGSTQAGSLWLLPLAAALGAAGLHFTVMLGNWGLWRLLRRDLRGREAWAFAAAAAVLVALRFYPIPSVDPGPRRLVAVIQGAADIKGLGPDAAGDKVMKVYSRLSIDAMFDGAKLLVWPEGVFPEDLNGHGARAQVIGEFAVRHGLSILAGGGTRQGGALANVALLVNSRGMTQLYQKRHLVPFGEYMPFKDSHPLFRRWAEHFSLADTKPGLHWTALSADGLPIAPVICFESLFGEELRSSPGGLLVVLADDRWFKNREVPNYHLQLSRLRAVESGRWALHTVSHGPSALIDPQGRVVKALSQGESAYLLGEVDGRSGSLFRRYGSWLPWFWAALVLVPYFLRQKKAIRL